MKIFLLLAFSLILLTSCEKLDFFDNDDKDQPCATVAPDNVPALVKSSFQRLYPEVTVQLWYNKDNKGYVALFTNNAVKTLAFFDNEGNFLRENLQDHDDDDDHDDDHDDDDDDCGCSLGDDDDGDDD